MVTPKSLKAGRRRTTFSLEAPGARQVSVVGDFNDWNPKKHRMMKTTQGLWQKAIMLPPGTYRYKFWVDKQWVSDADNIFQCLNTFGTMNSLVTVSPW